MVKIPVKFETHINIITQCSQCHTEIEATFIVSPDKNQIIASIDMDHKCPEQPLSIEAAQIQKLTQEKNHE